MIFITIGTQEPFDRLIQAIDELAYEFNNIEFIAQTFNGKYIPKNLRTINFINPIEFDELFDTADLIISHAGMGTIITALSKGKEIVVFPRLHFLGEHRNDHQLATARKMRAIGYVKVANNAEELKENIANNLLNGTDKTLSAIQTLGKYASKELLDSITNYINGNVDF